MKTEPGWYRDPYFLNHERYWENRWTDRVRRVEAVAPVLPFASPAGTQPDDATASNQGADVGAEAVGTAGAARQADAEPHTATIPVSPRTDGEDDVAQKKTQTGVTSAVYEDDTGVVTAVAAVDHGVSPDAPADVDTLVVPAVTRESARAANVAASPEQLMGWEAPPAARARAATGGRPPAGRRRRMFFGAAVVLVVVLIVTLVLVTRGGNGDHPDGGDAAANAGGSGTAGAAPSADGTPSEAQASSSSAAATIATAASKSAAEKTVVASITLTSADPSQPAPVDISGSGAFLLGSGEGPLRVTLSSAPRQPQKFLFPGTGNAVYLNVSDSPVPTKTWVVTSTADLPSLGPSSDLSTLIAMMGNPGLLINELSGPSLFVTSSGSAVVNGTSVRRYEVSFPSGPSASSTSGYGVHTSEVVDVDPNGLVRQIVISGPQATVGGQDIQEDIVVTFSGYRKSLVVNTPVFSQMISQSQYLTRPSP